MKPRDRGPVWSSPKNEVRRRPLVSLTMSREGLDALTVLAKRLGHSRGIVVEALFLTARPIEELRYWCATIVPKHLPAKKPKPSRKR